MSNLHTITIQGYKSIKDLESFELRRLNVLIGANGAGKSNLISFFKLLNNMTFASDNLQRFIGIEGGGNAILHDGAATTPQIVAKLDFQSERGSNEYSARLFHAAPDTLIFAEEKLRFSDSSFDQKALWTSLGAGHRESGLHDVTANYDRTAKYILALLKNCVVYQFHNTSEKARLRFNQPLNDWWNLKSDGANLAPFLYRLREEHPRYYQRIVSTIRQIAPFFQDFVLIPNRDNILLQWTEFDSDMIFSAYQASDGTLRTMSLVSLLLQPKDALPNVLILDEPELGLHPRAIDILAGLIHRVSFSTQVILATQSPILVNYFEPEDVVVVERSQRESTYTRLSSEDLEGWLEDYSLGELWQKNVTGGNPR